MRNKINFILGIMCWRSISKEKYLLQIYKCLENIILLWNYKFYIDKFYSSENTQYQSKIIIKYISLY